MKRIGIISLSLVLLLGMPLLGVWLAGKPVERYLEFPPKTVYIQPAEFSLPVALGFFGFFLAWTLPFLFRFFRRPLPAVTGTGERGFFPIWGWAGMLLTGVSWWLAWSRQPWMAGVQIHTFTPLWLGFILVVNALEQRLSGSCFLGRSPRRFLLLFPVSAVFWWLFEYLNRFVQNWHYSGTELESFDYLLSATLPFSTVLPAVLSVRELLLRLPRFTTPFESFHPVQTRNSRWIAGAVFVFTSALLFSLGLAPDLLFGSLWLSPLLLIVSLERLAGLPTCFTPLLRGDWRVIVASAVAALICGFFWEMWNFYSLARWTYAVPYLQAWPLFEMPLLGYGGYLPFGLECTVVASILLPEESR